MYGVGLVWVDCIMMTVDWFVFFLYCAHDLSIPAGITIWANCANEKRLSRHIWLMWCGLLWCTYRDSQCDWLVKIWDIVNAPDRRCNLLIAAFHTPTVEYVLCLTCFCRVWCEWYGLNIMWWSVCNDFCDMRVPVTTTGMRLFHYCITACVSTCDACSPHVIYFTSY